MPTNKEPNKVKDALRAAFTALNPFMTKEQRQKFEKELEVEEEFVNVNKSDGTVLKIEPGIERGATVMVIGEDEAETAAPDGEHTLDTGVVITVQDGVIIDVNEEAAMSPEEQAEAKMKAELKKRAEAVGLSADATKEEIEKAEFKQRAEAVGLTEESTLKEVEAAEFKKRAEAVGLSEDATEEEVKAAEDKAAKGTDDKFSAEEFAKIRNLFARVDELETQVKTLKTKLEKEQKMSAALRESQLHLGNSVSLMSKLTTEEPINKTKTPFSKDMQQKQKRVEQIAEGLKKVQGTK